MVERFWGAHLVDPLPVDNATKHEHLCSYGHCRVPLSRSCGRSSFRVWYFRVVISRDRRARQSRRRQISYFATATITARPIRTRNVCTISTIVLLKRTHSTIIRRTTSLCDNLGVAFIQRCHLVQLLLLGRCIRFNSR